MCLYITIRMSRKRKKDAYHYRAGLKSPPALVHGTCWHQHTEGQGFLRILPQGSTDHRTEPGDPVPADMGFKG